MLWRVPRRPTVLPAGFIEPCQPTVAKKAPSGPNWIHEIKHDGYRLIVHRNEKRARIFTRRGFEWTDKFPLIVEALMRLRVRSVTIDGEAVYCDENGISDFAKLHAQAYNDRVFLYAFDLLHVNGEDYRQHPLEKRKARFEKLLARTSGMRFVEHMEADGEVVFIH